MAFNFITIDEIINIHKNQIELYGGSNGIRDINLLESAIAMPQSGFGNEYLHKDIYEMAAVYLFHIVQNHAFIDGNKRVGLVCAIAFLVNNGIKPKFNKNELYNLVLNVAQGNANKEEIAEFFKQ